MTPFKTIKSRRIFEGKVLNVRVDTLDVGQGQTVEREIVEHAGAVVMAPLDNQNRVLLVLQYRHAADERLLELPAGTLEPGEDPVTTATRELQEETGFAPGRMEQAGGFYSAPGFCNEYLHFFIARDLREQPLDGDADEDIEVVPTDLARVPELIRSGAIKDAKSIAGLLTLLMLERTSPQMSS